MAIEIERRFLVNNTDWRSKIISSEDLNQAYLNSNSDKWTTRIRLINNNQAFITLKSSINGLINHEFEYPIPTKDAKMLGEDAAQAGINVNFINSLTQLDKI